MLICLYCAYLSTILKTFWITIDEQETHSIPIYTRIRNIVLVIQLLHCGGGGESSATAYHHHQPPHRRGSNHDPVFLTFGSLFIPFRNLFKNYFMIN